MSHEKRPTLRSRCDTWLMDHPTAANALVAAGAALAVIGLFAFVTFAGFGSSAEFVYNQF